MSEKEETPAQRAARLRRERREAKIRAGGTERLQRITGLGGRPASFHEPSPSPSRQSPAPSSPLEPPRPQAGSVSQATSPLPPPPPPPPTQPPNVEDRSPENIKQQEEYIRAFLRSQTPIGSQPQPQKQYDPATKLLSAFLGINPETSSANGSGAVSPGLGDGSGPAGAGGVPELVSPADLTSALGIPGPLAKLFARQTQPDPPEEQKRNSIFKIVHVVFALVMAWYLLFTTWNAVALFGPDPPPPSTIRNPFVVFMTGEVLLAGMRVGGSVRDGKGRDAKLWVKVLGDVVRDGRIVVFVLGMWSLWGRSATTVDQ
ncbi:hypothetical protein VTO42DRAFT_2478 [Malbranchea cinnamomea]